MKFEKINDIMLYELSKSKLCRCHLRNWKGI